MDFRGNFERIIESMHFRLWFGNKSFNKFVVGLVCVEDIEISNLDSSSNDDSGELFHFGGQNLFFISPNK